MEVRYKSSFDRDLKRIRDHNLFRRVERKIREIKAADSLSDISGIEKIRSRENYYRIRIGGYRLYLTREYGAAVLRGIDHRGRAYRSFP
ncbi:MAG: hypothetical protein F4X94_05720 [Dehalococcoidia bacterium]|nr:hypothetical protein [Dehalococcoidia bacterium]